MKIPNYGWFYRCRTKNKTIAVTYGGMSIHTLRKRVDKAYGTKYKMKLRTAPHGGNLTHTESQAGFRSRLAHYQIIRQAQNIYMFV